MKVYKNILKCTTVYKEIYKSMQQYTRRYTRVKHDDYTHPKSKLTFDGCSQYTQLPHLWEDLTVKP